MLTAKHYYGLLYGAFAGLAFAIAVWGVDDFLLGEGHALFPWLKFVLGIVLCLAFGGLAGWLTARLDKTHLALFIWLVTLALFSWFSLLIPFRAVPNLLVWLKPELNGVLVYDYVDEVQIRFGVTLAVAITFGLIAGVLQLVLSESAVFSASPFSKIVPLLVCGFLMAIAGAWIDNFNNQPMRAALLSVDTAIQYKLEHRNQPIDPLISRQLHLSSVNSFEDLIDRPYRLVVTTYQGDLGTFHLLVMFPDARVDCVTVYEQPIYCQKVAPPSS